MSAPVRIGIVGMGGYAAAHHDAVLKLEEKRLVRLVATCDPNKDHFGGMASAWRFRERGVFVFADHAAMLAACAPHLDLLVVAAPLPVHAEIHRAAAEAGLAVYLEKPPTLDHRELEQMIARDCLSARKTFVGFNFITEQTRAALRSRLRAGEFGQLRSVRLLAIRSRPTSYFQRCVSAGRVRCGECLVLDSPLSNELAHFVHTSLHWAGAAGPDDGWPAVEKVRAELYRAHLIESADTVCIEAHTAQGVQLRFAVSQAHADESSQRETVVCQNATINYVAGQGATVRFQSGEIEHLVLDRRDPLLENYVNVLQYLGGKVPAPATTLEDCRPFVLLNNLAFVSSGSVTNIPAEYLSLVCNRMDQKDYVSVVNLQPTLSAFVENGHWPSEKAWPRAKSSRPVSPADLGRIDSALDALCDPTPAARQG